MEQGRGRSALQLSWRPEAAEVLKRAGADGWTPLMLAAEQGDGAAVSELLAAGARADGVNLVRYSDDRLAARP